MTQTTVSPNFDSSVDTIDLKYRFKKDNLGNQRPNVEIKAKVPSVEGIVAILESGDEKQLALLKEAMQDVIRSAIAGDVGDDESFSQATYDANFASKYSWQAIANQDRTDRRASTIPAEKWAAFAKDYIEIMPSVANKSKEAVELATQVYLKKFSLIKTNKDALNKLKGQLSLYVEHTKNGEEFSDILELLTKKLDVYLKADDVALLVAGL